MRAVFQALVLGAVVTFGATSIASASADPVIGTWVLDVAKSKFSPGPAPKSQTRTYKATADGGIDLTVDGVTADGKAISQHSTFKYDGKDYPMSGSTEWDSLSLKQVDVNTIESVQKKGGKAVGTTTRTVSKDGKTLTLVSKGTGGDGKPYDNTMVFSRK